MYIFQNEPAVVWLEVINKSLYETVLTWAIVDFSHFISQTETAWQTWFISSCFPVCCFQVVEADIFSASSLKAHFKGQDVIMSCLGFPTSMFSAVTGYSQSMSAIISAMREARVNRIVTMTSWYTERKCFFSRSHPLCSFMYFALCLYCTSNIFLDLYQCK